MERKSRRKVGDGEGVPRRVFQKPVKVFPSPNTNFAQLHSTDKQIHTHTHTYNPTFYVKNTQQWSTAQLWFKAFFDWVGLRPPPDFLCGTVCRLQLYEHAHAHTYTSLMRHSVPPRAPYFVSLFSSLQVIQYLVPAPHTFWSMSRHSQFYHTYACMRSHKYVHTYANTDTHTHHVPLLSFYASCSPPNLFT